MLTVKNHGGKKVEPSEEDQKYIWGGGGFPFKIGWPAQVSLRR